MKYLLWQIAFTFILINAVTGVEHFAQTQQQCVGKHQIPINDLSNFDAIDQLIEPIGMKNFNVTPLETILENIGFTIVVNMKFNANAPTINFGEAVDLGTYRFEFLYFQWLENPSMDLPFELHLVFYDTRKKSLAKALQQKNMTAILAFNFRVNQAPADTSLLNVLTKNLKSVRTEGHKFAIENRPLNIWLPEALDEFVIYEGHLPFYDCKPQVLWVDVFGEIDFKADLLKELELLQTHSGQAVMKQYKTFSGPSGKLLINEGDNFLADLTEDSMVLVNAYDLYNEYGEVIARSDSVHVFFDSDIQIIVLFMLCLKLFFI